MSTEDGVCVGVYTGRGLKNIEALMTENKHEADVNVDVPDFGLGVSLSQVTF